MTLVVISSFHISLIVSWTRDASLVRKPLIANMNVGSLRDGEVTRKVMLTDAHTVCWIRIWRCTSLILKIRKVFGICLRRLPSSFARGAATPTLLEPVISSTAVKIFWLIFSLLSAVRFSFSKGIASSLFSASFSHCLWVSGVMSS